MLFSVMSKDDLSRLGQHRIDRLLGFFTSSLPQCKIQLDADHVLSIYCPHVRVLHALMNELEDLRTYAWSVLGVRKVTLYFGEEESLCEKILCTPSYGNTPLHPPF